MRKKEPQLKLLVALERHAVQSSFYTQYYLLHEQCGQCVVTPTHGQGVRVT